jgi:hypothetical protein
MMPRKYPGTVQQAGLDADALFCREALVSAK